MIPFAEWMVFSLTALGMAMAPGPNMIYLVSRSICQGPYAGFVSLLGVMAAFVMHIVCTAAGLSAIIAAVPMAYTALRIAGAAYLLWMAWQAVKPGSGSPFETRNLKPDSRLRLFRMGFLTNALNPKAAVFYISIFPQFIRPENGNVFAQSLLLGATQMTLSFMVNLSMILAAGTIAGFFAANPKWVQFQRWLMGGVLGTLAARMALE